jgi:hypothetical protein
MFALFFAAGECSTAMVAFQPSTLFCAFHENHLLFDCRFGERATHMPVRSREYIGGKHSQVRKVTIFIPNEVSVQNVMSQNRDG